MVYSIPQGDAEQIAGGMREHGLQGIEEPDQRGGHQAADALVQVPEREDDGTHREGQNEPRPAEPFLEPGQREDAPQLLRESALE